MVVFKVSRSRARYGRYGKKRKFGRKVYLIMYVEVEPCTADLAKNVNSAVKSILSRENTKEVVKLIL